MSLDTICKHYDDELENEKRCTKQNDKQYDIYACWGREPQNCPYYQKYEEKKKWA